MTLDESRCSSENIALAGGGLPFGERYCVRVAEPLEGVLGKSFLARHSFLQPGCWLTYLRFANDAWEDVVEVAEDAIVTSVGKDGVEVSLTRKAETIGNADTGFELVPSSPVGIVIVRYAGQQVATFNTAVEANEFVENNGYQVRSGKGGVPTVFRFGRPVAQFDNMPKAIGFFHQARRDNASS